MFGSLRTVLSAGIFAVALAACDPIPRTGDVPMPLSAGALRQYLSGHTLGILSQGGQGTLFFEGGAFEAFTDGRSPLTGEYRFEGRSICLTVEDGEPRCRQVLIGPHGQHFWSGDGLESVEITSREEGNSVDLAVRAEAFPSRYPEYWAERLANDDTVGSFAAADAALSALERSEGAGGLNPPDDFDFGFDNGEDELSVCEAEKAQCALTCDLQHTSPDGDLDIDGYDLCFAQCLVQIDGC